MKILSTLLPSVIEFVLSGNLKRVKDVGIEGLQHQVVQGERAKKTLESVGASTPISKEDFVNKEIDKKLKTLKDFMGSIMKDETELFNETDIKYIQQFAHHIYIDVTPVHDMKNVKSTDTLFVLSINHPFNENLTYKKMIRYLRVIGKNDNITSMLQIK